MHSSNTQIYFRFKNTPGKIIPFWNFNLKYWSLVSIEPFELKFLWKIALTLKYDSVRAILLLRYKNHLGLSPIGIQLYRVNFMDIIFTKSIDFKFGRKIAVKVKADTNILKLNFGGACPNWNRYLPWNFS